MQVTTDQLIPSEKAKEQGFLVHVQRQGHSVNERQFQGYHPDSILTQLTSMQNLFLVQKHLVTMLRQDSFYFFLSLIWNQCLQLLMETTAYKRF